MLVLELIDSRVDLWLLGPWFLLDLGILYLICLLGHVHVVGNVLRWYLLALATL